MHKLPQSPYPPPSSPPTPRAPASLPCSNQSPALVIEIIDGSAAEARRTVISKEDRRALFDYFKHRPPRPHREDRAASNAHETSGGGGGEAGSPAPTATAPPCPCSPGVPGAAGAAAATLEGGGEKGVEQLAGGRQVLNVATAGVESELLAPSSGAAAGFSSGVSVVSGCSDWAGSRCFACSCSVAGGPCAIKCVVLRHRSDVRFIALCLLVSEQGMISTSVGMYERNVLLRSALLRGRAQPFMSSPRFVHPVSLFLFSDVSLSSGLLKCSRLCPLAFIACQCSLLCGFPSFVLLSRLLSVRMFGQHQPIRVFE